MGSFRRGLGPRRLSCNGCSDPLIQTVFCEYDNFLLDSLMSPVDSSIVLISFFLIPPPLYSKWHAKFRLNSDTDRSPCILFTVADRCLVSTVAGRCPGSLVADAI